MKQLFFMFVMVFAISVTATASETIIDPSEDFSIENVIHTDFSEASQSTSVGASGGFCFQHYYEIFYANRLSEWGYGNISMVILLAWDQAESVCWGLREAALGTDYNTTPTWDMQ